jgi:hypothetical protein
MRDESKLLSDENQRLHNSNLDLAQANINLLSLLEQEKCKMPVRGKNRIGLVLSVLAIAGGQFTPVEPMDLLGAKFNSNILQISGAFILIVQLAGPYILQLVNAIRGNK